MCFPHVNKKMFFFTTGLNQTGNISLSSLPSNNRKEKYTMWTKVLGRNPRSLKLGVSNGSHRRTWIK